MSKKLINTKDNQSTVFENANDNQSIASENNVDSKGTVSSLENNSEQLSLLVGKNIALQRKQLGFTQKDLAKCLGITQDAVAHMEKGIIAPKMSRLQDIAKALQCSVAFLFRTSDDETDENAKNIADMIKTLPKEGQASALTMFGGILGIVGAVAGTIPNMINSDKNPKDE